MQRPFSFFVLVAAGVLSLSLSACQSQNSSTTPPASTSAPAASGAPDQSADNAPKRYHLEGVVVSTDAANKRLVVNHKEIPGFMGAMTMPYPVIDDKALAGLNPGDQVTADVVVTNDGVHLENIVVVSKGSGKPSTELRPAIPAPNPGDAVPDFALVNQDGEQTSLNQYRGKTLLITFIYTRCPLASYCPLVSHNFAQLEKSLATKPKMYGETHLLCISFDPAFDTPAVLRDYGHRYLADKGAGTFAHWEFAAITPQEKKSVLQFFNIFYDERDGQIDHSLRTAVISPDGRIFRWYNDSNWKPSDLLADVALLNPAQPS